MFEGECGARLNTFTLGLGLAFPIAVNGLLTIVKLRDITGRAVAFIASAATLVGGYILRETLIEAGKGSADDPHAAFAQPGIGRHEIA